MCSIEWLNHFFEGGDESVENQIGRGERGERKEKEMNIARKTEFFGGILGILLTLGRSAQCGDVRFRSFCSALKNSHWKVREAGKGEGRGCHEECMAPRTEGGDAPTRLEWEGGCSS